MKNRITNKISSRTLIGLLVSVVMTVFITACEELVEVPLTNSQLTSEAVFSEETTAEAALLGLYADMRSTGILSDLFYEMSLYGDDLDYYGSSASSEQQFYDNSLIPTHPTVKGWWDSSYSQIYQANAILKGLETAPFETSFKNQLQGESLVARAVLHVYLSMLYGDVPYISTTDYQENTSIGKTEATIVRSQALTDLQRAIELLPWEYKTTSRTRPNKGVALALCARIALVQKEWELALACSSEVLGHTESYTWEEDLNTIFLKESPTTLWQWFPSGSNVNTTEASILSFETAPPPRVALSSELINSFDDGDLRLSQWIKTVSDAYYHPYKYKAVGNEPEASEYSIVMRLAELYLIRSEAQVQLGQLTSAAADLNTVRKRAGLEEVTATSSAELLEFIIQERRHEFFTEMGTRFFDLKRTGQVNAVLGTVKSGWDPDDALLPLPESELLINPNLSPQNPGYE